MVSGKYIYYLFLMNALINIINFVPRILVLMRFHGALMAILIGTVVGTAILFAFTRLMSRFQGKGLPEIFNRYLPRVFSVPLLLLYSIFWFGAAIVTMLSFVDITLRFISPDISPYAVMIGFLLLSSICARLSSESILYALETILLLITPLIVYILVKSLTSEGFSWDAVLQTITYLWTKPNYSAVAGATFIFSGYMNLVVFNRNFRNLKTRLLWVIPVTAFVILLVTFLVPIGYHGTVGVEDHVYSWFSTADSIRMELFIIERVLFLFYTTYLSLSLFSMTIHWHVGLELFKGVFRSRHEKKESKKGDWWILIPVCIVTLLLMSFMNQVRLAQMGQWFLNIRFANEFVLLIALYIANKRSARRT
ncbi:GerAB/ArcD/ProY family transporter [Paenibacillus faecis]|uniref:GerAB/ArcD/ProY family transporter n=1 Tax=Paenibacillus faecis TaxID=862114 RepID=A0A5D0CZA1_9BACL|nr:GerAB/ArcD/ProY family transporter [Paenibacillus faecis]TYA15296.1 GerAB/ArcD/ProY family transporter [Paenibacillus faecis]